MKKGRSSDGRVFAVKFVHKQNAYRNARLSPRQLRTEAELHKYCGAHENVIRFFGTGEDDVWMWVAMEFASGGDLFDKIGMSNLYMVGKCLIKKTRRERFSESC